MFIIDYINPFSLNISRKNYDKLMFCKKHEDYGAGSFQYDDDPSKEEREEYYKSSEIARKYKEELPEDLSWYLSQRNSLFPKKFNIID